MHSCCADCFEVRAKNVTQPDGKKITVTSDDKVYGDFRYPGEVLRFSGINGFGFIKLTMDAAVGGEAVPEGTEVRR